MSFNAIHKNKILARISEFTTHLKLFDDCKKNENESGLDLNWRLIKLAFSWNNDSYSCRIYLRITSWKVETYLSSLIFL